MKLNNNTYTDMNEEPDDTSEYMEGMDMASNISFNPLTSDRFSNIHKIYSSTVNPTEIFSATRYGKRYILKGLNENYRQDPIQLMALSKEFEIGISLDHPNIRRTIGFEDLPDLGKVIILDYFDGIPLDKFISDHPLTPYQARCITEQIASALRYMNRRQIIHKDLKLSNILISNHGLYVSLIDFNLSDSDSFIILKNPAGTRKYMAPELMEADAIPSIVTDIYSFGVIIGELANAAHDPALGRVAEKCTATDPASRPQSVEEINIPRAEASQPSKFSTILSSKFTTYLLLTLLFSLAIIIFRLIYNRILV